MKLVHLILCTIVGFLAQREASAFTRPAQIIKNPSQSFEKSSALFHSHDDKKDDFLSRASFIITSSPKRSLLFSMSMTLAGAALGPFLDTYHSTFGVLQYDHPITAALWSGNEKHPALITAWWVPELFGVAGFLIGWLYIVLDGALISRSSSSTSIPSVPKILLGISFFTFQYWFSGVLVAMGVDRTSILNIMSVMAAAGFVLLDGSWAGLVTSTATALGGPLIEIGLLSLSRTGAMEGYTYMDPGETGFFPLWIIPVYFLGGPANGNLARGLWNDISSRLGVVQQSPVVDCHVCQNTRTVPCPNCDGKGDYIALGGRRVTCTSCRGRGFVICRNCFDSYGEDPYDIEAIREKMFRKPD